MRLTRLATAIAVGTATAVVGACSDSTPVGPAGTVTAPLLAVTGGAVQAGAIKVCKDDTSPAGTYNFTISYTGGSFSDDVAMTAASVAAGQCVIVYRRGASDLNSMSPVTTATITEVSGPGSTTCDHIDVTDATVPSNSGLNKACPTVNAAANAYHGSVALYVNRAVHQPPPPPSLGEVIVCKVAGTGVTVGTNFSFNVTRNGTLTTPSLVLPAGATATGNACASSGPLPAGTVLDVQEVLVAGNTVAITGGTVNLANRSTTVTVVTGPHPQTVVFTNSRLTPPPLGCVRTLGYWKKHPFNWPVTTLTLGTRTYTKLQLLAILHKPVKGNGLVSLSHQLIAAKLNIAAGASPATIQTTITAADAMIGSRLVPPVGDGWLAPSLTSTLNSRLDDYNEGELRGGPPHCKSNKGRDHDESCDRNNNEHDDNDDGDDDGHHWGWN